MYQIIVWDKNLAASGKSGCLKKIEIPLDFAKRLFQMNSEEFPILSNLSLDDYDLFSDDQLEQLIHELLGVVRINPPAEDLINSMVEIIYEAKSMGKSILFDPFMNG